MKIIGIDGCRNGWRVAISHIDLSNVEIDSFKSLQDIVLSHQNIICAGIDMVIGLPRSAEQGGRLADKMARKVLKKRGSVVFSAPCRKAAYAETYPKALTASRASGQNAIGLSKQSWNICNKIREVDLFLNSRKSFRDIFHEVHPELAFWAMNGSDENVITKHTKEGVSQRKELLINNGFDTKTVALCDVDGLDAMACLWSAKRIIEKKNRSVPQKDIRDEMGNQMRINW